MKGASPTQLDSYAHGYNSELTSGYYPKTAAKNWIVVILKAARCPYRYVSNRCDAQKGQPCKKIAKSNRGGKRTTPHHDRMVKAIDNYRQQGCQICTSRDWFIPRLCAESHIHGLCHVCWSNGLLRGKVPALLSKCPDRLGEADAAMLALFGSKA